MGCFALFLFALFWLAIVTVVGHGVWMLLAKLFGSLTNNAAAAPDASHATAAPLRHCARCDAPILSNSGICSSCSWPRPVPKGQEHDVALLILRDRIHRLFCLGLLKEELAQKLIKLISAEIWSPQAPVTPVAPAPSPTPTVETKPAPAPLAPLVEAPAPTPVTESSAPAAPVSPSIVEPAFVVKTPAPEAPPAPAQPSPELVRHRAPQPAQPVLPPPPPPEPAKPLSDILISFLEEKNIRWGELIGGLLIIGSSIALVVSFWSAIEARPLLKFGLFHSVAVAFFALGHYIHRHWKLANTSQGLLIIATLLVPLNALATSAFLSGSTGMGATLLIGELLPMVIFAALVYVTGLVITPGMQLWLMIAVIGSATSQFVIRRLATPEMTETAFWGVGLLVALIYAVPMTLSSLRTRHAESVTLGLIVSQFKLLGLATFSALLALGLLAARSDHLQSHFSVMSPLLPLVGWPSLLTGLVIWQRVRDEALTSWRTAGTAIAVFGAVVSAGAVGLAWPDPALIVAISLINFVIISLLAWRFDLPAGHVLAAASLACAYLVTMLVLRGFVGWREQEGRALFHALMQTGNALGLVPLSVLLGWIAWAWHRASRRIEWLSYASVAGAVAVLSVLLALAAGFGKTHDGGAWLVFILYASAALTAGVLARHAGLTWLGSGLALLAIVQILAFRLADAWVVTSQWQYDTLRAAKVMMDRDPGLPLKVLVSLLVHALAAMVAGSVTRRWEALRTSVTLPLERSATLTSLLAVATLLGLSLVVKPTFALWPYVAALGVIWAIAAFVQINRVFFAGFQLALYVVTVLLVTPVDQAAMWYPDGLHRYIRPNAVQHVGIAFVVLGVAWVIARQVVARWWPNHDRLALLHTPPITVDMQANRLTWVTLIAWCLLAALPGVDFGVQTTFERLAQPSYGMPGRMTDVLEAARGGWTWAFWGAGLMLLIARMTEGVVLRRVGLLIGLLSLICPLLAAPEYSATLSVWRWYAAGLLVVLTVLYLQRQWLRFVAIRAGLDTRDLHQPQSALILRTLILAVTGLPIVLGSLPTFVESVVWLHEQALEPMQTRHWVTGFSPLTSHLVPMGVLFLCMVAMAIRDRSPKLGLLAGLLLHVAATLGYVLWFRAQPDRLSHFFALEWLRLQALVGGTYVLAWLAYLVFNARRQGIENARINPSLSFQVQQWLVIIPASLYALLLASMLFVLPQDSYRPDHAHVGVLGWLAWLAVCGAVLAPEFLQQRRVPILRSALLVMAAGVMLGLEVLQRTQNPWLGFHVWQVTQILTTLAWFEIARRFWTSQRDRAHAVIGVMVALLVVTAWRGMLNDPQAPWWSFAQLLSASLVLTLLASARQSRWMIVPAALLVNVAISHVLAIEWGLSIESLRMRLWNVIALCVPCVLWVWHDQRFIAPRHEDEEADRRSDLPWHRVAPLLAAFFLVFCLLEFVSRSSAVATSIHLGWLGWGSMFLAVLATAWDRHMRRLPIMLFGTGLLGITLAMVHAAQRDPFGMDGSFGDRLLVISIAALAAYLLLTSDLWRWRWSIITMLRRHRVPLPSRGLLEDWQAILPVSFCLSIALVVVALTCDFRFDLMSWRLITGTAALLQVVSLGLLAHRSGVALLHRVSLVVGAVASLAWVWAWLPATMGLLHLDRVVAGLLACVASLILLGYGTTKLFRRERDWIAAAAWLAPMLLGVIVLGVIAVMGLEASQQLTHRRVVISTWSTFAMIGVIASLIVLAMTAALVPGRDPLNLSERGRTGYVYAAEVLCGLLYLHVRMTMPWLFQGLLEKYWPLIVLAIAFVGVGASEIFRRQNRLVLYEPFERSAALLPVLPVLGFWIAGSEIHYSWTMLIVGAFYGVMAIRRHSFTYSILATLAANGALWYLLGRYQGYSITEHPQLWLIPPAVSVLIAAHLNRNRLTPQQLTAIRYMTSSIIYVSSTADIMLRGVREAPWLPLVLGGLAIAGMLLGIALRVRAFLFLGGTFLVIALGSMIKYAAVDLQQTWIWYVSGIIAGVLIIAVFAVFEKKRNDVLRMVNNLRQWEQ